MDRAKSESRILGYKRELDMCIWLRNTYLCVQARFEIVYKDVFDICGPILIDSVGIDERGRLICGHKQHCREHRYQVSALNKRGYVGFIHQGTYYFLNVESSIIRHDLRPKVNAKLLSACVCDPLNNMKKLDGIYNDYNLMTIKRKKEIDVCYNMPEPYRHPTIIPKKTRHIIINPFGVYIYVYDD